jgi:hypothetical protein
MSRDVKAIFNDIDSFDPDRFVAQLTPDVVFRFANGDPVVGRAATRETVAGFSSTIDGITTTFVTSGNRTTRRSRGSTWNTSARTASR